MAADEPGNPGGAGAPAQPAVPSFPEPEAHEAPFSRPEAAFFEADGSAEEREPEPLPPIRWKLNLALFLVTALSVFFTGGIVWGSGVSEGAGWTGLLRGIASGWPFAVPLLAILLTHEFGHYIAARIHRVDASLPYFIPFPFLSPFGTMGAVISMRGRIRSRDALLDIGASGPLAGLCVAIPVLVVGLLHSPVERLGEHGTQEGQCLLYMAMKWLLLGPIPPGYDVMLTQTALAGWAGIFVTMLNLVAVAQLDGGHIAYALFGPRQNRYARILHGLLLVIFAVNLLRFAGPVVLHRDWGNLGQAIGNAVFWLVWYVMIRVIMRVGGPDHPPTEPGELHPVRKVLAVLSLVLFALLFMPTPWSTY
jgi:membrane-associated protease RseP (regulator of RpoE activity)